MGSMKTRTALGLILRNEPLGPVPAPKPPIKPELLVKKGINPHKQRKGKSGEIAR